jgi:uncharacterized protein (DUF849 family)
MQKWRTGRYLLAFREYAYAYAHAYAAEIHVHTRPQLSTILPQPQLEKNLFRRVLDSDTLS